MKSECYTFAFFKEKKKWKPPVYGYQELGGIWGVGNLTLSLEDLAKSVFNKTITDEEHSAFSYTYNTAKYTMNVTGGKKTDLTKKDLRIFSKELEKVSRNHFKKLNEIIKEQYNLNTFQA